MKHRKTSYFYGQFVNSYVTDYQRVSRNTPNPLSSSHNYRKSSFFMGKLTIDCQFHNQNHIPLEHPLTSPRPAAVPGQDRDRALQARQHYEEKLQDLQSARPGDLEKLGRQTSWVKCWVAHLSLHCFELDPVEKNMGGTSI